MVATAGNGWRLAPSLVRLVEQVDAKWPKRDRSYDGSIGDAAHAARASEHNPDRDSDPMPRGYVSAVDITKDSAAQMDALRKILIADPRTWYVIHNGRIYSRTYGFRSRAYTGANSHTHHMHVSLMQTAAAANDTRPWGIGAVEQPKPVTPGALGSRTLSEGATGADVVLLQKALGKDANGDRLITDGTFGPLTIGALKSYQKAHGLDPDGIAGPKTYAALGI